MPSESILYITCDTGAIPVERPDGTPESPVKEWTDNGIHMRLYRSEQGPIVFVDYPDSVKEETNDGIYWGRK